MKPALLFVLALIPLIGGCGREPKKIADRDGWYVVDDPAVGPRGISVFAVQRASLTPLRGSWENFHPVLIIEPRDDVVPGAVRIRSVANYVDAPVGPPVALDVSFDGGPPEPVSFVKDNMDLEATRGFADRLMRHRTVTINLPGRDKYHPPGVVTYRLDGLAPQLAALDAEFRARREGVGFVSRVLRQLP